MVKGTGGISVADCGRGGCVVDMGVLVLSAHHCNGRARIGARMRFLVEGTKALPQSSPKGAERQQEIYWLVSQIGFRPTGTVLFVIVFTVPAMSVYFVYCVGTLTLTVVQVPLEQDFEVSQIAWPVKLPLPV